MTLDSQLYLYVFTYRQPWQWWFDNESVAYKYDNCEGGSIPMTYATKGITMLYYKVKDQTSPLGDVVWIVQLHRRNKCRGLAMRHPKCIDGKREQGFEDVAVYGDGSSWENDSFEMDEAYWWIRINGDGIEHKLMAYGFDNNGCGDQIVTINGKTGDLYLAPMQTEADQEWTQIIGAANDNSVPADEYVQPAGLTDTVTVYNDGDLIFSTNCDVKQHG